MFTRELSRFLNIKVKEFYRASMCVKVAAQKMRSWLSKIFTYIPLCISPAFIRLYVTIISILGKDPNIITQMWIAIFQVPKMWLIYTLVIKECCIKMWVLILVFLGCYYDLSITIVNIALKKKVWTII